MTNTLNVLRDIFESTLDQQIRYVMTPIEMLKPMLYSLKNGGKRLRPLLLLASCSMAPKRATRESAHFR